MAEMTASCGSLQSVKKSIVRCVTGELYNLFCLSVYHFNGWSVMRSRIFFMAGSNLNKSQEFGMSMHGW